MEGNELADWCYYDRRESDKRNTSGDNAGPNRDESFQAVVANRKVFKLTSSLD